MTDYEPELMYALDSEGEYSDWKNVYNVSGDDVLFAINIINFYITLLSTPIRIF